MSSRLGMLAAAATASTFVVGGKQAPAGADNIYSPPESQYNGKNIYLSVACHDRGTGSCQPNFGCADYNENNWSKATSVNAADGSGTGSNLVERGYKVRVGTGTLNENVANSNAWGSHLHVPVHSNAVGGSFNCNQALSGYGTQMLYVSDSGAAAGKHFLDWVGESSPGGNDVLVYRTNLGELNGTNMTATYLEAEFHTWNTGVKWLSGNEGWTWRIGAAIDNYFGYP